MTATHKFPMPTVSFHLTTSAAVAALRAWETRYNYERFSLVLQGRTPAEELAALHPPQRAA